MKVVKQDSRRVLHLSFVLIESKHHGDYLGKNLRIKSWFKIMKNVKQRKVNFSLNINPVGIKRVGEQNFLSFYRKFLSFLETIDKRTILILSHLFLN